uniref:ATP synthase YMF19-like N-terminal domain-containing protein n=1 Tax=Solanum lycopersicum TaxID=4081 RepID=A0A3Q7JAQ9_SOLLC
LSLSITKMKESQPIPEIYYHKKVGVSKTEFMRESFCLNQSRMPQLDKFTYFTQFFWSYKIYHHVFDGILLHSLFGIVPSELLLLDHYINQPDKDPEWVEFQLIYYGREDPQFFVDPQDLDSILRVHLEPFEFNHPTLFYAEVKRTQADRSVRVLISLGLTWFTRYWFPEELISPLAKPFLTLPLDSYFVRTQSTEAFPTYVATSPIACSYFVFPLISHQIWCFLIPSCYGEQRTKYNRFLHLSGSRFSLFLFLTPPRVVPNVWHFPYFMGATSTNSLMIKLQPKIYDHIMLTVRISFIPSVCSQVPVIVIRLPEPRGLSVETSTNYRHFLMVFPFVASIVQVREEGWTSGMRESGSINKKEE